jgi:adenine-specific DNA methylase
MIPRECKRLAEVDFPIAVVSKHAAREKSIRHGNPSTLHLWWARRPIASCRAVLLALLLPDPCDPLCPPAFQSKAREILRPVPGRIGQSDEDLREALLRFIGDFADWDRAANGTFLEVGRSLVRAAHPGEVPLVVDPFAGGGSIPLEALRLGCDAFASDLNPIACLILKTILEDIPRQGPGLADELRQVCNDIKASAKKELAKFYAPEPSGVRPIAYLWARTVRCEAPNCGAEIPLLRSFWLSKKKDRRKALRYAIQRPKGSPPHIVFEVFTPKTDAEVPRGTVTRAKATCPCCGTTLAPDRVRSQLQQLHGGADPVVNDKGQRVAGATLMAVVTKSAGNSGANYRLPVETDYHAIALAIGAAKRIETDLPSNLASIPDEPLPLMSGTFNVPLYGVTRWGDLFTRRQNLALATLVSHIRKISVSDPIKSCLAMVLGRCVDYWSSGTRWAQGGEFVADTFARPALPIIFDFVEVMPFSGASGDFDGAVEWVSRVIEALPAGISVGQVSLNDARKSPLPDDACTVWFTDPPYYFAVPYADLSDFFFVWHKRAFPDHALMRDPFDPENALSPKGPELCEMAHWDSVRYGHKDKSFFESGMAAAFSEGRRVTKDDGIASVVFAHKTTEGWEALLSGITKGGWIITGSWPIATERPGRPRSQDSAALATSVHLICRPRTEDRIGDWAEVLRELPSRVGNWMARLEGEGVHGADLLFACIGPALEVFSRYSRVETPDGREVPLAEYLEKVWEVVGRTALEQVLGTAEAQARNDRLIEPIDVEKALRHVIYDQWRP